MPPVQLVRLVRARHSDGAACPACACGMRRACTACCRVLPRAVAPPPSRVRPHAHAGRQAKVQPGRGDLHGDYQLQCQPQRSPPPHQHAHLPVFDLHPACGRRVPGARGRSVKGRPMGRTRGGGRLTSGQTPRVVCAVPHAACSPQQQYDYTRSGNPTRSALETLVAGAIPLLSASMCGHARARKHARARVHARAHAHAHAHAVMHACALCELL